MRARVILSLVMVIAALVSVFGCARPAEETSKPLTIGISAAMSGTAAAWGQSIERGVAQAVKDINSKGGVKAGGETYRLDVKTYDHAFDPSKALEIAKRMVTIDKVWVILSQGAATTKPIIPLTEENRTMVAGGAAGREIMTFQPMKYFFRWVTDTYTTEIAIWQWMLKNRPNVKNVAFLKPDDASGRDEAKDHLEIIAKLGIPVVYEGYYKRGATDFYPILTALVGTKPDVIDLGSDPPADQGRIIKQARELGFAGEFLTIFAANLGPVFDLAGKSAEGLIYSSSIDPSSTLATPEEKAFYDRMMEAYSSYDAVSIQTVVGIYPVAEAAEKANSIDPDKVMDTLYSGKFTVLGREVKFGGASIYGPPPRQALYPLALYVIENSAPKLVGLLEMPAD